MSVLAAALEYRQLGFAVLPLHGKQPYTRLIRKTHGVPVIPRLLARGAHEEHLRLWFSRPDVNIGIFCGEPSEGLVVLDFDDCEFPPPGMRLPLTPTVKTGRHRLRGHHLYYRTAEPVAIQSFPWGELRGWPKSTNGSPVQVVAPPSRHPKTGRSYGWQLPYTEVAFTDFGDVDLGDLAAEDSKLQTPSWSSNQRGSSGLTFSPRTRTASPPATTRTRGRVAHRRRSSQYASTPLMPASRTGLQTSRQTV